MRRDNVGDSHIPQSVDGENGGVNALQFVLSPSLENTLVHSWIVQVHSDTESIRVRTPLNGGKDVGLLIFCDKKRETDGSLPSLKEVRDVEQTTRSTE